MAEQKKSRKFDRNRKHGQNLRYKAEKRHEKSHLRRVRRHMERYGKHEACAREALLRWAEHVSLSAFQDAKKFLAAKQD